MRKNKSILFFAILSLITFKCETSEDGLVVYPGPYLGIQRTGEADPTPLGGDNDGDWFDLENVGFNVDGAYPNPTNRTSKIRFQTARQQKIIIYIHHPFTKQTAVIFNQVAQPGSYEVQIDFKDLNCAKGFLRVYFNVGGNITYGDIFYE